MGCSSSRRKRSSFKSHWYMLKSKLNTVKCSYLSVVQPSSNSATSLWSVKKLQLPPCDYILTGNLCQHFVPLILPCEDTYTTHPTASPRKPTFTSSWWRRWIFLRWPQLRLLVFLVCAQGLKRSLWSVDNGQAEAICWSNHMWFLWVCLQRPWDGCDEVRRQQKHSKGDCFIAMIAPRMTERRHCGHKNRKKTYHRSYICCSELCALCPHCGIWVKYTKGPEQIKLWWDEQKQY